MSFGGGCTEPGIPTVCCRIQRPEAARRSCRAMARSRRLSGGLLDSHQRLEGVHAACREWIAAALLVARRRLRQAERVTRLGAAGRLAWTGRRGCQRKWVACTIFLVGSSRLGGGRRRKWVACSIIFFRPRRLENCSGGLGDSLGRGRCCKGWYT